MTRPIRHLRPEDLRGLRWRGYIRESTAAQADRGTPPERQKADIIRAANELGMVGEPYFYERTGSGEAVSSELQNALEDGRAGLYDVLVVFHTSRFARNRAEAVTAKAAFARAGIIIYFVSQRLISGTYAGGLAEGVSEVIDAHENETRRLFIAGGLRERQMAGRWVGHIPFGYRAHLADNPDGTRTWDGTIEPDESEAAVVRRIFSQLARGDTQRTVARNLNLDGLRTRRGGPWTATTVDWIAHNPTYAGRPMRYREERPGRHYFPEDDDRDGRQALDMDVPALVSESEWQMVAQPRRRHRAYAPATRYPLSPVLRCVCGRPMTGYANHQGTRYYRCAGKYTGGSCAAPSIRADVAEQSFADWLDGWRLRDDWKERLAHAESDLRKTDEAARRARLEGQLSRLKDLYTLGDLTLDEYREKADAIRSEIALTVLPNAVTSTAMAAILNGKSGKQWLNDPGTGEERSVVPSRILRYAKVENRQIVEWTVRAEFRVLFESAATMHSDEGLPTGTSSCASATPAPRAASSGRRTSARAGPSTRSG